MRSNQFKVILVLMLFTLLMYYYDEHFLAFFGFPINSVEEDLFDNITLLILIVLFLFSFLFERKLINNLKESEEQHRSLIELSPDAILVHDGEKILYTNPSGAKILGANKIGELIGKPFMDLVHPDFRDIVVSQIKKAFQERKKPLDRMEQKLLRLDGQVVDIEASTTRIRFMGKKAILSIDRDITERKKAEETIGYMVYHDQLTGLPNRNLLNKHMETAFRNAKVNHKQIALLFIDLDGFKNVNDKLGHEAGDRLLQEVSIRLKRCVEKIGTAARWAGDEFVILLPDSNQLNAVQVAESILKTVSSQFMIKNNEVIVTPSIGISLFPQDGEDGDALLKHADMAMYQAKKKGKNNYQLYGRNRKKEVMETMK
jgi:diguanylate cyclase (GGDEF)-like protein/PAS domain S-box-containing protein